MIKETLVRQANQAMGTLVASIRNCPDELLFRTLPQDQRTLADLVAHAIGPIVETLGPEEDAQSTADAWPLRGTFTKADLLDCATHILEITIPTYLDDNDLTDPDEMPEYFISKLDRVMKVLRHLAHHTGEVHWILRQSGVDRGPFIGGA